MHVYDTLRKGATSILARTVDTDVVVILVGVFYILLSISILTWICLWVGFGAGKHFRYYHINSVCLEFGEDKCQALPSFTGFDVTF